MRRRAVMSPSGGGEPRRHYTVVLQGEDILPPQILFYIPMILLNLLQQPLFL